MPWNDGRFIAALLGAVLHWIGRGMNAYRFRLPLNRSLVLKGTSHTVREGILLQRDGQWAEASPLPGFSPDTMEDVVAALRDERPPTASLRFALACLEEPFPGPISVPINVLLQGDALCILDRVKTLSDTKIRAAKLKVGRNSLAEDIDLVRLVRSRLPGSIALRLDANQAWSMEQAVAFVKAMDDVDFEYIEEPLQRAEQLEELFARTGCRYALDETLLTAESLDGFPNAVALICKPTILGGRPAIERLLETNKMIVFSAAFESGVGIARIAQLAAKISPEVPAGLDTLSWFENDILTQPIQIRDGDCVMPCALQVDPQFLEKIEL